MIRCLLTFPPAEMHALIARSFSVEEGDTPVETARQAFVKGFTLQHFTDDELLRICDAASIPLPVRNADAARAAIKSARNEKFRHVVPAPASAAAAAAADDESDTSESNDVYHSDYTSDDNTLDASLLKSNAFNPRVLRRLPEPPRAPSKRGWGRSTSPSSFLTNDYPAMHEPTVAENAKWMEAREADPSVPCFESPHSYVYWAALEGTTDPTTKSVISLSSRIENRRAYAESRHLFNRGEYVVFDNKRLFAQSADLWELGTRIFKNKDLSPNYFMTVVGAEEEYTYAPVAGFFCDVVWESQKLISGEQRPMVSAHITASTSSSSASTKFLIDTGSAVSILSFLDARRTSVLKGHPCMFRRIVSLSMHISTAPVYWVSVDIQKGEPPVIHPFVVIDTPTSILGMDFLVYFEFRMIPHRPITMRLMPRPSAK